MNSDKPGEQRNVFVRIKKGSPAGYDTKKMLAVQALIDMDINPNDVRIHVTSKIPAILSGSDILLKPGPGGLQQVNLKV